MLFMESQKKPSSACSSRENELGPASPRLQWPAPLDEQESGARDTQRDCGCTRKEEPQPGARKSFEKDVKLVRSGLDNKLKEMRMTLSS